MTKISRKYRKKAETYKYFSRYWGDLLSYDNAALEECFLWESQGIMYKSQNNGYVIGKKWMDVNIAMWKEDILRGLLLKEELEDIAYLID